MEHIDLVALLKAFQGKGIEKVEVYGKIVRQLPKPENIHNNVKLSETGIFVEMSVFAVNLGYHQSYLRQNGVSNKDNIYMVNGNIIAYINAVGKPLPDWYSIRGTLRFGTKDMTNTYVGILNYIKQGNDWYLSPCELSDIDISGWTKDSECYFWINKSRELGVVEHPQVVKALPHFNSVLFRSVPTQNSLAGSLASAENGVSIPSIVSAAPKFNKECRSDLKEPNKLIEDLQASLQSAESERLSFIKQVSSDYKPDDNESYIRYMLTGLLKYIKNKPGGASSSTGRALLNKYLANFKHSSDAYVGKMSVADYLITIFDEIAPFILDNTREVTLDGTGWEVCCIAFADAERFYAGMLSCILGLSYEDVSLTASMCKTAGISFIRVVNENPYLLCLLSPFKFSTIEFIALCFGQHNNKELSMYKDVAMLNDYIEDTASGSTVFTKDQLVNANIGVSLTAAKFKMLMATGSTLTSGMQENIGAFLRPVTTPIGYEVNNFRSVNSYQYVERITSGKILTAIQNYSRTGLGVDVNNYITSSGLLEKELFVFNAMYTLAKRKYDYPTELIDKYIGEYEDKVGFRLEERQRMAVHLITNAGFIVAGSAGSGKTTVSNCIVFVLSKLEPSLDIEFAAPTGKAAKRMQEVVHQEVKTLHSKFKIGNTKSNYFEKKINEKDFGNIAYFFDEGAMITIDLLYAVLKKIDIETSRIFLFGDFNQLPPIGKGLPFKNLLRFMPCVFLNVTKRAADGSKITANSNYINEYSDTGNWRPLESGDDFFLMPCKSDKIQSLVVELCKYYLGKTADVSHLESAFGFKLPTVEGLTPDDIQVVSPLSKASYQWGTTALNKILQPLFNSTRTLDSIFIHQLSKDVDGCKYIVGDRVIHVDKNMYSMQWYETYKDGHFRKMYGAGICNGEVGKIVGFYPSTECSFYREQGNCPADFEYPDNIREDMSWYDDDKWFIVVEYYDYIKGKNFYILYRAEVNNFVPSNEGIVFKGDDLSKLNLFYAGTTHKLQGSQAKVIICPLDTVTYTGFITREMLYTMTTRGEKLVFMLGSVDNSPTSMLSRARKDIASVGTLTVGEIIV